MPPWEVDGDGGPAGVGAHPTGPLLLTPRWCSVGVGRRTSDTEAAVSDLLKPRRRPCASCPYRRDVPSGLWAVEEYDKLARYDGSIIDQATAGAFGLFFCHQQDGNLCAGWVGCHDMRDSLAVRMKADRLDLDAVLGYRSPVPLFASGAEAAEHGKRDINDPGEAARRKIRHLLDQQDRRGVTPSRQ